MTTHGDEALARWSASHRRRRKRGRSHVRSAGAFLRGILRRGEL